MSNTAAHEPDSLSQNVDYTTPTAASDSEKPSNERHTDEEATAPAAPTDNDPPERSTLQIALLMTASCMSVFLAALDITIVTTALPTITEYFGSASGFTWVGSAFMLAAAVTTMNWGKFSDVWGRKPVLLAASAIFFLGCALCGAATSLTMLIAGRAVQGVGAGGLLTLVNIIIGDLFSARERGKYYGIIGMVWATASALGPVIGGALTNNVSWRWIFYINLPISGVAFVIIVVTLKLPSPKTPLLAGLRTADWIGSIALAGGTLMFLLGLQFGGDLYPWRSATVICLLVFGVVTVALFIVYEHRVAQYPLIPTHLYNNVSNLSVLAVCLFHGLTYTQLLYFLPTYFQAVLGATPLLSGVWLLASCLVLSIVSIGAGLYLKITGRYYDINVLGFLLCVLGSGLLLNLPTAQNGAPSHASAWARIIMYQVIAGAGSGLLFQPPLVALQANVPQQNNAAATSSFSLMRNLASAIGVVAASVAITNKMAKQRVEVLAAAGSLDPAASAILESLLGPEVQANLFMIQKLPPAVRKIIRAALYDAIRDVWIESICFSAAGLISCLFIKRVVLQHTQETIQTGIAGEEERRRIALEARNAKKAEKKARKEAKTAAKP